MQIRRRCSEINLVSGGGGFSLPEVLVALFITGLFVSVLTPIMRDTLYYVGRLTERLPMARTLESNIEINRSEISTPTTTVSFATNGLKIVRSIKPIQLITKNTFPINRPWQLVVSSIRVESPSGIEISKDIIMLRRVTK